MKGNQKGKSMMEAQSKINNSELPPGWRWVRLEEVCEIVMGQSPPGHTYTDTPNGLPFFQGKADFTDYFPKVRVWCTQPLKIAEEGDILISVRAPVGPVNMNNLKCCIGRGVAAIRCKDKTINWFIFWYLRAIEIQIASLGSGSTFGAITRDDLISLQIPLPPIEEQQRIAIELQELMKEIEHARAACEKQLEAAKALPAAYLREVFESEEARKWERKPVVDFFEKLRVPKQYEKYEVSKEGKVPVIDQSLDGIYGYHNNDPDFYASSDSPLVTFANHTCHVRFMEYNFSVIQNVFPLKVKSGNDPRFFYYLIQNRIPQIEYRGHWPMFEKLILPKPPLPIQQRIAAELKEKMAQVENLQSAIRNQQSALDALPQAVLRKAFRGEL